MSGIILAPRHRWHVALPGVQHFNRNVARCKCESSGCSGDAKITTNVQALLDRHPDLGAPHSITVQTRAGVVYLYGEVSTGLERETAESLTEETPGVARVVDSIFVSH